MKKIILSAFVLVAVSACKKQNETTEISENTATTEEIVTKRIPMVSVAQTQELLAKKNDTLYITNFFATWCGPCVREIPHFKKKIEELKNQPVKITFISLDQKEAWNSVLPNFTKKQGITDQTILLDGTLLDQNFFAINFKQWDGNSIPFTFMRKGDQIDETNGMITEEQLNEKIEKLLK